MARLTTKAFVVLVCGTFAASSCLGQSSPSGSTSSQGTPSTGAATQTQASSPGPSADTKKKKVWTNDDVSGLNDPVSVVGNAKNSGTPALAAVDGKADSQYIANTKKQLEKLQAQLADTDKQLAALKDFMEGKRPESAGYQINRGYNREPVDQQVASLEDKKKQLQEKIGALLDEARKKGVLPGQLR